MPDNLTMPFSSGTRFATDEIEGTHYSQVKIVFGGDGFAIPVTATDRLPVSIGAGPFAVSAQALPLPAGAATEEAQLALIAAIGNIAPGGGSAGDASAANQAEQTALLSDIRASLADDPTAAGLLAVIDALQGKATGDDIAAIVAALGRTLSVTGPLTNEELRSAQLSVDFSGTPQPVFIDGDMPLTEGAATEAKQIDTLAALVNLLTQDAFEARIPTLGTKAASGSVSTTPSSDQDPIFNEAQGARIASATGASADIIVPPAGAKYLRIVATTDTVIRTDGTAAADAAGAVYLSGNVAETIPVTAGTKVTARALAQAGIVYATPMKVR